MIPETSGQTAAVLLCMLILLAPSVVNVGTYAVALCETGHAEAGGFYLGEDRRFVLKTMETSNLSEPCETIEVSRPPLWAGALVLPTEPVEGVFLQRRVSADNANISDYGLVSSGQAGSTVLPVPAESAPPVAHTSRGAWYWSPDLWRQTPELLWQAAAKNGLDEIYVTVPTSGRQVQAPGRLASFIAASRERALQAHRLASPLKLDLVVPYWWGSHPDFAAAFFRRLPRRHTSLTVMAYQTGPGTLADLPLPFLAWGDRHNRGVRVAVETGTVGNELRQVYRPADRGEVWLVRFKEVAVLMLFDEPQANLSGQAFRHSHEIRIPETRITFAGNLEQMETILQQTLPAWQAWPSFEGITIHGLEEQLPR